ATSPARQFLNSTFNETPSSIGREGRPELMIHPDDAAGLGIAAEDLVTVGNRRGEVKVHARLFEGLKRGVVISEGLWPNSAFVDGKGINTLTGADPVAPFGGAAVHDIKVWVRAA
ncbi:MAG: molybdopterin oxidoreductase family protein, partial [Rhizobiales bacterium]|nr:molybdopterin oxidoreductase family protein [Hyphomicrobiales bacterium]